MGPHTCRDKKNSSSVRLEKCLFDGWDGKQREQVAPEEEEQEEQLLARQEVDERLAQEEGDKRWLSQLAEGSVVMLTATDKNGKENAFMTAKVVATPRGGGVFHIFCLCWCLPVVCLTVCALSAACVESQSVLASVCALPVLPDCLCFICCLC
jgi:hypothetical protein